MTWLSEGLVHKNNCWKNNATCSVSKEIRLWQESARWYVSKVGFILIVLIYQELNIVQTAVVCYKNVCVVPSFPFEIAEMPLFC